MQMSVTRALAELKLLSKRISKEITTLSAAKDVAKVDLNSAASKEFKDRSESDLQSITKLIDNASKIKAAIIKSNAETEVEVAGRKMTVAEAIAYKDMIGYEIQLKDRINTQLVYYKQNADRSEANSRSKGEAIAAALAGQDKGVFDKVYQSYMDQNTTALLVSPKVEEFYKELDKAIDEFDKEVDFVLSESNTRTTIEVDI